MKRLFAFVCVLVLASASAHAREGFGFKKKAVDIMKTVPPALNSGARRVKVDVSSERGDTTTTRARFPATSLTRSSAAAERWPRAASRR